MLRFSINLLPSTIALIQLIALFQGRTRQREDCEDSREQRPFWALVSRQEMCKMKGEVLGRRGHSEWAKESGRRVTEISHLFVCLSKWLKKIELASWLNNSSRSPDIVRLLVVDEKLWIKLSPTPTWHLYALLFILYSVFLQGILWLPPLPSIMRVLRLPNSRSTLPILCLERPWARAKRFGVDREALYGLVSGTRSWEREVCLPFQRAPRKLTMTLGLPCSQVVPRSINIASPRHTRAIRCNAITTMVHSIPFKVWRVRRTKFSFPAISVQPVGLESLSIHPWRRQMLHPSTRLVRRPNPSYRMLPPFWVRRSFPPARFGVGKDPNFGPVPIFPWRARAI